MNHVLPFHQKVTIDYYLLDEVNPCVVTWYIIKLLINSKIEDIFFENHKINELYQLYQHSYLLKNISRKTFQNINKQMSKLVLTLFDSDDLYPMFASYHLKET